MKDMRESELVKLGPCAKCGRKLFEGAHGGMVPFYVVTVAQGLTDPNAIRRHVGLEMQVGAQLARIMGPDEPLAKMLPETQFMLHQMCALDDPSLMGWVERADDRAAAQSERAEAESP